jgi:DNA-binding NarL/FixJ family response regulator
VQKKVRVLLCDDQVMIRIRVREALAKAPGISVVGEAAGGHAGVKMALELVPDLVLMDVSMPDVNGIEATRQIRSSAPSIRVLAFSAEGRRETLQAMVAAGACGYLLKDADPEELVQAIYSVMDGGFFQSASLRGTPVPADGAEHAGRQLAANDFMKRFNAPRGSGRGSWSTEYLSEKKLVVASLTGTVTNADAKSQSEQAMRLLMDHEASLVLVDCREAVSEISYAVLYWLPRFYAQFGVPRSTRIAVVLPAVPYRVESFQFYALACTNAGYDVRLFESRQAAEEWLLQEGRG